MATTLPDDTTKADFDAGSDDPKQARVEFATNADIQNELKVALGDFAQFNNQADSGLETVGQSGGTPDDIQVKLDGVSIKRGTNGVAVDAPHERKTVDYLAVAADRGKLIEMDKATAIVLNLTAAGTLGEGWFIYVNNSGAGALTIDPNSTETIDDVTTIALGQNQSAMIFCDGTSFWTVGKSGGKLVQVVNVQDGEVATGTTATFHDDSIPQITEGTQFMSLAITPKSSTNLLVIQIVAKLSHSIVAQTMICSLFQDSTANALAAIANRTPSVNTGTPRIFSLTHKMTAGTTSETTFKVRCGTPAGATTTFNGALGLRKLGGVLASSITVWEITP